MRNIIIASIITAIIVATGSYLVNGTRAENTAFAKVPTATRTATATPTSAPTATATVVPTPTPPTIVGNRAFTTDYNGTTIPMRLINTDDGTVVQTFPIGVAEGTGRSCDGKYALITTPGVGGGGPLLASIIRLSSKRHSIAWLITHFKRSRSSIENDLDRFEQRGVEGLADGQAPGQPAKITSEITAFLESKLLENRTWNCSQLAEEINGQFGTDIKRDTIRVKLLELGYSWKRGRFSPGKTLDAAVVAEHRAELEELQKKRWIKQ